MDGERRQIELYGEPLRERFARVIGLYGISQRRLARALGLSAPMLSQLISAKRVKIGNPAVYERLVLLEQRSQERDLTAVLTDVEATRTTHSTTQLRAMTQSPRPELSQDLAAVVPRPELESAASQVETVAPTLHRLLREALGRDIEDGPPATR